MIYRSSLDESDILYTVGCFDCTSKDVDVFEEAICSNAGVKKKGWRLTHSGADRRGGYSATFVPASWEVESGILSQLSTTGYKLLNNRYNSYVQVVSYISSIAARLVLMVKKKDKE
jgi:hypothetical protein